MLFAGHDLVSVDAAVASYMGFNPKSFPYLVMAEKMGVGKMTFEMDGPLIKNKFKPSVKTDRLIFNLELKLRDSKLKGLFFDTPLFNVASYVATAYNTHWWYLTKGRKYVSEIMNGPYRDEFKRL
jgi:hypothetical protein